MNIASGGWKEQKIKMDLQSQRMRWQHRMNRIKSEEFGITDNQA